MKYFFVLGNNSTLSVAEILSIFKNSQVVFINPEILILDLAKEFDAKKIMSRMGGVIKIGKIINEPKNSNTDTLLRILKNSIDLTENKGKFKYGFSYYGQGKINTKVLGMELKKSLQENGISSRFVVSKDKNLSSVVVETNKLLDGGWEIVLIKSANSFFVAKTLAVQPFKELSYRDYGRPNRDDQSGMLPPKLAQIMINLASHPSPYEEEGLDGVILDPFCGSGTILTEAILMGRKNLIGTDISTKAISDTEKNIHWVIGNCLSTNGEKLEIGNLEVSKADVQKISQKIKKEYIDYIITEPYLGPQRGFIDVKKIKKELGALYTKSLIEFYKILKPKGRIVMIWPVFCESHNVQCITPILGKFKIINPIPEYLRKSQAIKQTDRGTIIYGREGQRVWRELVILDK